MKLEIELVPKSSWYKNLRNNISKQEWDRIRKEVYRKAGNKCGICKSSGRLFCHEVWKYDDVKNIQSLTEFKTLCEKCHYIKHLGFVNVKTASGELPKYFMNSLIEHFCKVNNCSIKDFREHESKSYQTWLRRSKKKWKIDVSKWLEVINKRQSVLEI